MSDKRLPGPNRAGTLNDPDDISTMASYLLMNNMFETLGIVVASTHRVQHRNTPDQGTWANDYFGKAYRADLPNLNELIGGYPKDINFIESCIKKTAERYKPEKLYESLYKYPSVNALFKAADTSAVVINVLCWGSLTEPAILVNHCLLTKRVDILRKLKFIAHWTRTNSSLHQGSRAHPEKVANCAEDAKACAYMKRTIQSRRYISSCHQCSRVLGLSAGR